mmetsp:Transcript_14924/g.17665  ORF Transcript_14924/g.17665 Transcript_14924/m.17665 type:complete len:323 (-) Transcript_14924:242-1210(-)
MGERKVLNKYIPADFDPRLVPRGSKPKDDLIPVRMMLPFSVQCKTCSSFMYRGRKFNSKKEAVKGPEGKYLGIQKFRFYIKCTACSRPVTFLTDPKNTDYEMESGATRNYEVHKDRVKTEDKELANKELKEKEDPMKALENRVLESQREMAELDNLDEIKAMNMRQLKMMSALHGGKDGLSSVTSVLRKGTEEKKDEISLLQLNDEDEALVKSIKFGKRRQDSQEGLSILRLGQVEEDAVQKKRQMEQKFLEKQQLEIFAKTKIYQKSSSRLNPMIKVKRRRIVAKKNREETLHKNDSSTVSSGLGDALGLLGGYGSDSDSD